LPASSVTTSRALGQQFVIENVAGAGGTIGSTRAMRASPNGYTIEMGQMGTHAAAVALYPNLAYKPDVGFEPIGLVVGLPIVITAKKKLPANNLKEFILYVKANAEKVNVAHAGVGSITHTTCLLLNSLLGVKPTFVPFLVAAHDLSSSAVRRSMKARTSATMTFSAAVQARLNRRCRLAGMSIEGRFIGSANFV
jgi:tripartite-type tricarboxylate transporter receptor subunit TctC